MPHGDALRHVKMAKTVWLVLLLVVYGNNAWAQDRIVLTFGDSLTAGYGLPAEDAFVARLQATLRQGGDAIVVRNGSVSGDTTPSGRARLAWTLAGKVDLVILELGANDSLRGVDPFVTRTNLDAILAELARRKIPVLLAGMLAPPNLGPEYEAAFNSIYPDLARQYGVRLYPFFLDGVAAEPALNQHDGLHPNAAGVRVIVAAITPYVLDLLKK